MDYPFFDYGSPSVTEGESELLDHYAKLWPAPPAILVRAGRRYALPPVNRAHDRELTLSYAAVVPDGEFGIVVRSRVERAMWRYRDLRALRPVLIDAGHVVEMVTFLLARLGIAAEVVSAAGAAPGEDCQRWR